METITIFIKISISLNSSIFRFTWFKSIIFNICTILDIFDIFIVKFRFHWYFFIMNSLILSMKFILLFIWMELIVLLIKLILIYIRMETITIFIKISISLNSSIFCFTWFKSIVFNISAILYIFNVRLEWSERVLVSSTLA